MGLEFHLSDAKRGNTFNAHRLIRLAGTHGVANAMEEHLSAAYFKESQPIGDLATLQRLAVEVGLDPTRWLPYWAGTPLLWMSDLTSSGPEISGRTASLLSDHRGAHGGGRPAS